MPTRDEILNKLTHKDQGLDLRRRVHYTLAPDAASQMNLTTKALALLIAKLHEKKVLSDAEIDDLLLSTVM